MESPCTFVGFGLDGRADSASTSISFHMPGISVQRSLSILDKGIVCTRIARSDRPLYCNLSFNAI